LRITKYIAFIILLGIVGEAHAQGKKEPWFKRNWNNMIARYNIYFNADQKMQAALADLALKQSDDFNTIIPIYPYGTEADAKNMRPAMEEVMKKASKVIQNKPKSKWSDDAYFIIGQTQFFGGDYYASIESFQFVNSSYTDEYIKAMSQLWLMKSYIQQEKHDDAEAIYGLLKKNTSTNKEFRTHLNLSAGDLMVKQNKYKKAIELLISGQKGIKNKVLRYRTYFVLGQLYMETEDYTKASESFLKVLRLNAPYEYVFQANLGMAKSSTEAGGQGAQKTKKYLKKMLDDDKNLEYYDQIYYELAKIEFNSKNEAQGISYMQQSAAAAKTNTTQRTKTYQFLADYYFNNRNYTKAQAYYDSTVSVIPESYPNVDKIKAKHSVLSKLIENVETIRTQDSLIALSKLDREVLDKQIDRYIEEEIKRKKEAEDEAIRRAELAKLGASNPSRNTINTVDNSSGSQWYFYNASTVARGSNDFNRTWGNRKLTDFWRFVNKSSMSDELSTKSDKKDPDKTIDTENYIISNDKEQNDAIKDIDEAKKKYYANIPFSATALLVANKKIEAAYLNIGTIYFDELKEYVDSKTNLEKLINKYPKTSYKPEALFYLSKAETELGNMSQASKYAKDLADNYPETLYNSVLNSVAIEEDNSDVEAIKLYEAMYDAYEKGNYTKTIEVKKQIDKSYPGSSIQGKIDYLYALTIGQTKGKEAYLLELKTLEKAYTGTEIGEMASYTIRLLTATEETKSGSIYATSEGTYFYVITGNTQNIQALELQLADYNQKFFGSQKLLVTKLIFGDKQLFYIKQFEDTKRAMVYHNEMVSNDNFLKDAGLKNAKYYAISEANFKKLIQTNTEEEYISFFAQKYK
jgi:tetratricopeptide (TPR) repeat protein